MKRPHLNIGLPLFMRELANLSARPSTYMLRVGYACLLFFIVWQQFGELLAFADTNQFALLGRGRALFEQVFAFQMWGIMLFMPAITCGAIAHEKETNTLPLLLITRLKPGVLVIEKLLSRMVPMFTFLLLSMPLMAFAYAMGGVSQFDVWSSVWYLALIGTTIGMYSLMCSAYAASTVSAFFTAYATGLPLALVLSCCGFPWVGGFGATASGFGATSASSWTKWAEILSISVFVFGLLFVLFMMASVFLVTRAAVTPRNYLLEMFRAVDLFYNEMNNKAGGIILINDSVSLPGDEPISWRETSKKSLGTIRYLVRVLTAIEIPLLAVLVFVSGDVRTGSQFSVATGALYVVWTIAMLLVAVKATSLVSGERAKQTLNVLLTVPLSGSEIFRQEFHGVRRLIAVLYVPFLTIFFFQTWWYAGSFLTIDLVTARHLLCSVVSVLIFLPLIAWISFAIGLKVRSQARAIVYSLFVTFTLAFGPVLIFFYFLIPNGMETPSVFNVDQVVYRVETFDYVAPLLAGGPGTLVVWNEARGVGFLAMGISFAIYGALLYAIRTACHRNADRLLGRC